MRLRWQEFETLSDPELKSLMKTTTDKLILDKKHPNSDAWYMFYRLNEYLVHRWYENESAM